MKPQQERVHLGEANQIMGSANLITQLFGKAILCVIRCQVHTPHVRLA